MMVFHGRWIRCMMVMLSISPLRAIDFCAGPSGCSGRGACYTTYCQCYSGFFGDRCQNDCQTDTECNGGKCLTNSGGEKFCQCLKTNYGRQCQFNQVCTTDAECQNGGTCNTGFGEHVCDCVQGYSGSTCRDVCSTGTHCNGGSCVQENGTFVCSCPETQYGLKCENNQICVSNTECLNGGTCNQAAEAHACDCAQGYSGNTCGDACTSNTDCNGGTCVDGTGGKVCNCTETRQGPWCENVSTNLRLSPQLLPLLMIPVMYKGQWPLW